MDPGVITDNPDRMHAAGQDMVIWSVSEIKVHFCKVVSLLSCIQQPAKRPLAVGSVPFTEKRKHMVASL